MQYLYLIKCREFYKIGIANDVQSRLAQLSTGNPFELEPVTVSGFDNAIAVETVLHQRFASRRRRGEWFELSAEDVIEFDKIVYLLHGSGAPDITDVNEAEIEDAEEVQEVVLDDQELDEDYHIQIQGTDRKYPAVVLRRKGRGAGATIQTISKFGKYAHLYDKYQKEIQEYLEKKGQI